eukprot:TRINITY_DN40570_c0_g1_i1.p1 TRINITY_DN40570_c0_g1~~TRINITY_DN40570_c0_g1_i1.p1  ORF type:complete len:423 (+),score=110.39 TRINITY_DN40570_c0_g1_i1:148-1416(+)
MEGADNCTNVVAAAAVPRCPGKVTDATDASQEKGKPKLPGVTKGGAKNNNTGRTQRRRAATADSATQEDQCHPRKIFIGGLAHKTTTQNLRDYFAKYGAIVDAVVLRWPDGRSRGFGYVTFADASGTMNAMKENHTVGGRQVDVKRAVPGTNKLFVGGLPQNTTAIELREHFEAYGVVSDAVVMIDPATNRSRGFGFVCFLPGQEGAASAAFAIEQYQNHRIRGKWIEVKSAAPPHKLMKDDSASPSSDDLSVVSGTPCESPVEVTNKAAPILSLGAALKQSSMGPLVNDLPVASPLRRRNRSPNEVEPMKVGALSYVSPTEMPIPGVVGTPPGLAAAAAFNCMGMPPGLASDWSTPTAAQNIWAPPNPVSLSSALGGDLTAGFADFKVDEVATERKSAFSNSVDLQKSLEQLIRLKVQERI